MTKQKNENGYRTAVRGAQSIIRILIYIFLILFIIFLGKTVYSFGYDIFHEQGIEAAPGQDVTVTVPPDSDEKDIAGILKDKGLIKNETLFRVQVRLSRYKGELKAGKYLLNTSQTPSEMMEIIAQANTEGQPEQKTEEETTQDQGNIEAGTTDSTEAEQ